MAYHMGVKRSKKKAKAGSVKSATAPVGTFALKSTMQKTISENTAALRPHSIRRRVDVAMLRPHSIQRRVDMARLVDAMDLDEMLEASKLVEMGIKGVKIPLVKSAKARRYAGTVLRLNSRNGTKRMAEQMVHDLNVQIIKVNKETTDSAEAKRLYRELMAEE